VAAGLPAPKQNSAERKRGSIVLKRRWNAVVCNKNERAELEMQITKYRNFLLFIVDEEFRKAANEKIAELEKKLREIDE
jgi:hypothetical protein